MLAAAGMQLQVHIANVQDVMLHGTLRMADNVLSLETLRCGRSECGSINVARDGGDNTVLCQACG